MEREDIEKAAKSYQEKDHDIWTGEGMAVELQKSLQSWCKLAHRQRVAPHNNNSRMLSSCYIYP